MSKEKIENPNTMFRPRFASAIFQKRSMILAFVVLLIAATAFGAFSSKAFSSKKSAAAKSPAKSSLQVSAFGQSTTVRFRESGRPWINLAEGREIESAYRGDEKAIEALAKNIATPLSLTSADFDSDGVRDVVAGYAVPGGGIVVFMRGNADALYPNSPEAQLHKKDGTFTDAPFLSPAYVFAAPTVPEFLGAGDFDGDGYADLAMANRNSSELSMMQGTGKGVFETSAWIDLPGTVTAFAVGDVNRADGLTDIVVTTVSNGAAQMLVFESPRGAFNGPPEISPLSSEAAALAIGQLDNSDSLVDIAVAAGKNLFVVHGRDRKLALDSKSQASVAAATVEQRAFDVALKGVAIGDFTDNVENDLAVLGADGSVQLLNRKESVKQKAGAITGLQAWKNRRLNSTTLAQAAQLVSARFSSLPYESLLIVDAASNQVQVLTDGTDSGRKEAQSVAVPAVATALFEVDNGAAVVMSAQLNSDSLSDLIILRSHQSALSVVPTVAASTFSVTNTNDSGAGSLRQAIIDANLNAGADTINFAIGSGTQTISPLADLPAVTDPATIDATTQPGFAGSPIIELNGTSTGSGRIFKVSAGNTTIRGLVINRCSLSAVTFQNVGGNKIEGCYIGTDVAGTAALANGDGVAVFSISNNTVGGTTAAARNVLSGNSGDGLDISGAGITSNFVQGNYIGVDATGAAALANQANGVYLNSKANTIGGATAAERNIISGNIISGVRILNDITVTGNKVQGNYIGTNAAGNAAIGNGNGVVLINVPSHTIGGTATGTGNLIAGNTGDGVSITEAKSTGNLVLGNIIGSSGLANTGRGVFINLAPNNTIGGVTANAANIISFNGGKGVVITGASGNAIRQNSIGSNTGIGIDLGDDGVTANDTNDPDAGANDLQNFPVINFVTGGATTTIQGTLNSIPGQTFTLEFYLSAACDASGFGEGETFIGSTTVTTTAAGNASFNVTLPVAGAVGQAVTATAVTPNFSTSEFSACVPICVYSISPTSQNFTETGGTGSIAVTSGAGCAWTAVSNAAWITVTSGASGIGNGTVNFSVAANNTTSARMGTITIADQTFTVNQAAAPCTYSILPTSQSFTFTGGTGSVAVTATTGCAWTAVSNDGWITVTGGASGTGNGTVNYSVAAKADPGSRTGTITIAGQTFTVTQSGTDCAYSIAPTSQNFAVGGGTGNVTVTTTPTCNWTASSNAAWITITSGASGTGSGTVNFSVAANPDPGNRTGTMTIAGQTFTVTQDGTNPCTYAIAPTSQAFSASGGSSGVAVTATTGCAWTAVSNNAFITVTSGAAGTGNGTVNYSVAANATGAIRVGTITIAGQTFTVTQAGASCVSSISPASNSFLAAGGSGLINVSAALNCNWTSTSLDSWITIISGATGAGSQKVKYNVAANPSSSTRIGSIIIGGFVHTVTQAGSTCNFSISPTSQNFVSAGGSGTVNVTTQAGCAWSAVSNDGFITINSGASGTGNGTVSYTVTTNISAAPRTGTMTIAGQTFTVTQDAAPGACVYSISPTSQNFTIVGGNGNVAVTATAGCAWTAISNAGWISVTGGASGTGNGTVNYSVAANPDPSPRTGTMTIAGQTFTVTQDGNCDYFISPTGRTFISGGGVGTVSVTAAGGCAWSAISNAGWITVTSGASGTGNGTVTYVVAQNTTGASRTGTITIAGKTHTVKQNP